MKLKNLLEMLAPYEDLLENNIIIEDDDENGYELKNIYLKDGEIIFKIER